MCLGYHGVRAGKTNSQRDNLTLFPGDTLCLRSLINQYAFNQTLVRGTEVTGQHGAAVAGLCGLVFLHISRVNVL